MGKCILELKFTVLVLLYASVVLSRKHSIGWNSFFNVWFHDGIALRGSLPEVLFLECFLNHPKNLHKDVDNKCFTLIKWCYSADIFSASPWETLPLETPLRSENSALRKAYHNLCVLTFPCTNAHKFKEFWSISFCFK